MTLPSVIARFSPTSNACVSVSETVKSPVLLSTSVTRFSRPSTKDFPLVSRACVRASGFVPRKFDGEKNSIICFVKKLICFLSDLLKLSKSSIVSSIIFDDIV